MSKLSAASIEVRCCSSLSSCHEMLMKSATHRGSELALLALLTLGLAASAAAGPREQAKRMHDRLVGVPPPAAVLDSMEASINGGDPGGTEGGA